MKKTSPTQKHVTIPLTSASPWAVVLAGGFGRRLEPVTRALNGKPVPKQFCDIGRGSTLLQDTVARLRPTAQSHRTVVVADVSLAQLARQQVGGSGLEVVAQPLDRGTAPGVLLPLMHILIRDPDATVVVTPSDHAMADSACFRRGIDNAIRAVEQDPQQVILFGVEADSPRTDYGWIIPGDHVRSAVNCPLRRIVRFTEKPPVDQARVLHGIGALWNTFVMVGKGLTFLNLYRRRLPDIARFFEKYARLDESRREAWLFAHYDQLADANFSKDILQSAPNLSVYTWPVSLAWTDLGTPDRLFEWLESQGELEELVKRLKRRGAGELIHHYRPRQPEAAAMAAI